MAIAQLQAHFVVCYRSRGEGARGGAFGAGFLFPAQDSIAGLSDQCPGVGAAREAPGENGIGPLDAQRAVQEQKARIGVVHDGGELLTLALQDTYLLVQKAEMPLEFLGSAAGGLRRRVRGDLGPAFQGNLVSAVTA
jgi:hypothetical protein